LREPRGRCVRNAKSRPKAAFGGQREAAYLEAAPIADEAAAFADEAASAAAVAELLADIAAEAAPESAGVVTTVVEVDGVDIVDVAGGVTVVVDSSFLLHAANETAAARVTINRAVFMFLLDFEVRQYRSLWEPSLVESPIVSRTRKARAFPVPNP
jgi:hypothetical protein